MLGKNVYHHLGVYYSPRPVVQKYNLDESKMLADKTKMKAQTRLDQKTKKITKFIWLMKNSRDIDTNKGVKHTSNT